MISRASLVRAVRALDIGAPRQVSILGSSSKAEKAIDGWTNTVVYMTPGRLCPWHTKDCLRACVGDTGMLRFSTSRAAKAWKTRLYERDRSLWRSLVEWDVRARAGRLAVRLDGSSDTGEGEWLESLGIAGVKVYDYTASLERAIERRWDVTYSIKGADTYTEEPYRSSVVIRAGVRPLPHWIDGNGHDLTFLRGPGVLWLRFKGHSEPGSFALTQAEVDGLSVLGGAISTESVA